MIKTDSRNILMKSQEDLAGTCDLNLVWDKQEQIYSEKYSRQSMPENTKRNLEEYFEFLSSFEYGTIDIAEDKRVDKQFVL